MASCGHQGAELVKPVDLRGGGLLHTLCTFRSEPFPEGPSSPPHQPALRGPNHSESLVKPGPSAFGGSGTPALLLGVSSMNHPS